MKKQNTAATAESSVRTECSCELAFEHIVEKIHREKFANKTGEQQRLERLFDPSLSFERVWNEINDPRNRPTPQATIEAILLRVRERGVAALNEPENIERLQRCDDAARTQIDERIAEKRGK